MGIHLSEIKPLGALSQAETRDAARALWAEAGRVQGGLSAENVNAALEPFRARDPSLSFETVKAAGWLDAPEVSARRGVTAGRVTLSDLTGTVANAPTLPRMTFAEATTQVKTVAQRLDAAPAEIDGISIKAVYLFGSAVRDNNSRPTIGDLDISADFGFDARYSGMDPRARTAIAIAKWQDIISNGDERLTLSDAAGLPDMGAAKSAPGKEFHVVRLWQNDAPVAGSFTPAQQASMDALAAESMATQSRAQSIAQAVTPLPALSPAQTAETLKGWYLLRSYNKDFDPLSTVMDLPPQEAIAVMERIHPHRGIGPADAGGNRSQAAYHQLRGEADSWIRSNSTAVKTRENPVFFALTNDPETVRAHMNAPGNNVIITPVNEADLSKFSFTFDDSMGNYRTTVLETARTGINGEFLPDTSPVHGRVMNAEQLAAAIKAQGTLDAHGAPRNIEAQYWGAEPVQAQTLAYDPDLPKPAQPAVKPVEPETPVAAAAGSSMTLGAKVNNTVDGAMGALGLVSGTMGAIRAAEAGDEVGVVINTANAVSGGTTLGISIARGMGHEIAPALGNTISKANIALTVATGFYQIAAEKGNLIDTEADGSHNLGNKGERAVAVVATSVTAIGLGAAGVGSAGVVPAVVAVAVVGDKAIEARRAWKDVDRTITENSEPQRRTITDDDGSPDMRKFKHIFPEMLEVSADMRDSALPFTPKRDPRTGRIDFEDMRRMMMSEDPKVIAEFERALDTNIRKQQQAMKENDSFLPKWLRFDDGGTKYTTAQMILADLQGAKTELGWYKAETVAWNAAHPDTARTTEVAATATARPRTPGM